MIIVVGGIKGGSGKTTIATNLTVMRSLQGHKVLLVDADEQRSASSWTDQREVNGFETPWTTVQLGGENAGTQIRKMMKSYDDIVIDVGGRNTRSQRSVLLIADVYIVPFLPRSLDIWTLGEVKSLISRTKELNESIKCYGLINRGDAIGNDNKDAIDIISDCSNLTCIPLMIVTGKREI